MLAVFGEAVVEHMIKGRVRLRFRSRRNDRAHFQGIVDALRQLPQVSRVEANPRTGSVLILHTATPEEIAALGLPETSPDKRPALPSRAGRDEVEPAPVTLGLAGLAILQATRGRLFGSAAEHFWQASQLRRLSPVLAGVLVSVGLTRLLSGRLLAPASSLLVYATLHHAGGFGFDQHAFTRDVRAEPTSGHTAPRN